MATGLNRPHQNSLCASSAPVPTRRCPSAKTRHAVRYPLCVWHSERRAGRPRHPQKANRARAPASPSAAGLALATPKTRAPCVTVFQFVFSLRRSFFLCARPFFLPRAAFRSRAQAGESAARIGHPSHPQRLSMESEGWSEHTKGAESNATMGAPDPSRRPSVGRRKRGHNSRGAQASNKDTHTQLERHCMCMHILTRPLCPLRCRHSYDPRSIPFPHSESDDEQRARRRSRYGCGQKRWTRTKNVGFHASTALLGQ
jgi:hypothetical protein